MNNSDDLDPRLQHWYKQLTKEQPSPELDAKILAAAQQAIKKPSRWLMPFSMAASLVMVSSLVLYWAKQPEALQQATATSSSPEKRIAETKVTSPAPANEMVVEENSELSGGNANVHPQREREKPLVMAKSHASMAMEDNAVDELKGLHIEPRQNNIDNQSKEINEEVVNITSSQSVITKQDATPHQESDNRSSFEGINQPVVAESAMPEQQVLAAAPPISAGAIASMAKRQATEKKELTVKDKMALTNSTGSVIEGLNFGMSREQLLAIGFTCQLNVCSKILNPHQQVSYWGIPASQATLQALLHNNKVSQLVFLPQVDINTVVKAIDRLGVVTDSVCDEKKNTAFKRVVNGYLLQVYQQEKSVNVVVCVEK